MLILRPLLKIAIHRKRHFWKAFSDPSPPPTQRTLCTLVKMMTLLDDPLLDPCSSLPVWKGLYWSMVCSMYLSTAPCTLLFLISLSTLWCIRKVVSWQGALTWDLHPLVLASLACAAVYYSLEINIATAISQRRCVRHHLETGHWLDNCDKVSLWLYLNCIVPEQLGRIRPWHFFGVSYCCSADQPIPVRMTMTRVSDPEW